MHRSKIIYIGAALSIPFIFIFIFIRTSTKGKEIFIREGCAGCHSFRGQGGSTGPDLTSGRQRRSVIWIISQIRNPKSHNPDSRMPEFPHLSLFERYAIVHYLKD
ncbi:MAG: cytochrome c [Nitrospiraceae bacterium]|nr:MAG: cytochrome c [Nitrospiraceae bacterium]